MGRSEFQQSPEKRNSKLTVAEILSRCAGAYVNQYPCQAAPQVQSTLAKLSLCRTAVLGGHKYRCSGCDHTINVYNSCGDRCCPTCSGARRSDWLESARELIFEGVDHFQVVFTLPSELSRLALGNRKVLYDLLFTSASSALKRTIGSEHGFECAGLMVLHTWNQKLDAHAHVHAVVPGCGPALDGSGVRFAQRQDDETSIGRYLVDADCLRTAFRDIFLRGLNRLRKKSELKLAGEFQFLLEDNHWEELLAALRETTWVSHIQAPPRAGSSAEQVLKYLARYLAGGPISDSRIVATDQESVTFMARQGEVSGGDWEQVPMTLSQVEFTRRWCLHVLPAGYTKTRRFGGWSNIRREQYLERLAIQLQAVDPALAPLSAQASDFGPFDEIAEQHSGDAEEGKENGQRVCPQCGSQLIPHSVVAKPSWAEIMASPRRPNWYRQPLAKL